MSVHRGFCNRCTRSRSSVISSGVVACRRINLVPCPGCQLQYLLPPECSLFRYQRCYHRKLDKRLGLEALERTSRWTAWLIEGSNKALWFSDVSLGPDQEGAPEEQGPKLLEGEEDEANDLWGQNAMRAWEGLDLDWDLDSKVEDLSDADFEPMVGFSPPKNDPDGGLEEPKDTDSGWIGGLSLIPSDSEDLTRTLQEVQEVQSRVWKEEIGSNISNENLDENMGESPSGSKDAGDLEDESRDNHPKESTIYWASRVGTAYDWISWCDEIHDCDMSWTSPGVQPSRLIQLDSADADTVRLVQTATISDGFRYTALSHCWGSSGIPYKLNQSTMSSLSNGIPLSTLPRTFRDAVLVTRGFGLWYIWIDALCIIQPDNSDIVGTSHEDWEKESARMGDIYANAYVTLAADGAADSSGGLFLDIQAYELPVGGVFKRPHAHRDQVSQSPLSKRGWVLQEMALSPRVIHFARDQMYWQCGKSTLTSEDNYLPACHSNQGGYSDRSAPYPGHYDVRDSTGAWWQWCHQYSSKLLKYQTDRLAAFAGITRHYKQKIHSTPIAGLWRSDLHINLLWRAGNRSSSIHPSKEWKDELGIPSWSWFSTNRELLPGVFSWIQDRTSDIIRSPYVSFGECVVTWVGEEFTSSLSKAEIHGEGKLLHLLLKPDEEIAPDFRFTCLPGRKYIGNGDPKGSAVGIYLDDEEVEMARELEVACLPLAFREGFGDGFWDMHQFVLILREDGVNDSDEIERYKRIGVGHIFYTEQGVLPKAKVAARLSATAFIRDASVRKFVLV